MMCTKMGCIKKLFNVIIAEELLNLGVEKTEKEERMKHKIEQLMHKNLSPVLKETLLTHIINVQWLSSLMLKNVA